MTNENSSNDFYNCYINIIQKDQNCTSKIKDNNEDVKFLELIGKGGFSNVYKGILIQNNKTVAIKVLDKAKKVDKNELKISEKLKNKNVNDIYYSYKDEKSGEYNIIMEYSKLGNLKNFQHKFLEKNYLSETLLCFISYQILNGLKYIHKCKIAHLDIKPQNILIDEYLNVKLIDFSISLDYSKIKTEQIQLRTVGTSFYIAPEILNSDTIFIKDLNKVDLFSLGIIIFNMAFGYYPFGLEKDDAKNYKIIYEKIMKNNLEFDNDDDYYSSYFIDFLKLLLEKDINKRINIYEALNNYWIKGAEILLEEKENLFNAEKFLGYLVTDHIKNFDDYISKKNLVENSKKISIPENKKNLIKKEEYIPILENKNNLIENEVKIENGVKNHKQNEKNNFEENEGNYLLLEDQNFLFKNKEKNCLFEDYEDYINSISDFECEKINYDNMGKSDSKDFFPNSKSK